ncbi:MAG: hypothetical protein PHX05_00105 [Acidobacteriota bacterium]|nr:hypothetical protein [Acidobacteriota bacterium]
MKLTIALILLAGAAWAGPLNLRNETRLREWKAERAYRQSPDYYSPEDFARDVAAAKNFSELQAAMNKKAKAEKEAQKAAGAEAHK